MCSMKWICLPWFDSHPRWLLAWFSSGKQYEHFNREYVASYYLPGYIWHYSMILPIKDESMRSIHVANVRSSNVMMLTSY